MEKFKLTKQIILQYVHISFEDDDVLLEIMKNATLDSMEELIPNFDRYNLTGRQMLIALTTINNLYNSREKYAQSAKKMTSAASSFLMQEIYGGDKNVD